MSLTVDEHDGSLLTPALTTIPPATGGHWTSRAPISANSFPATCCNAPITATSARGKTTSTTG